MTENKNLAKPVSILLVGGFGHAVFVFDEWLRDDAPVRLVGAVQTLPDETLDKFLAHPLAAAFTPAIYQDLDEALAGCEPDLVVVSTRPDLNPDIIERCLRAGCQVIAEKPLAVDEAGLVQIHRAAVDTGRSVLPMLGMHESPAFAEARELVAQGVIGEPVLVNARKSYPPRGAGGGVFSQRGNYGGNWAWVGIHAFNNVAYITGRKPIKVLAAHEQNRFHPELSGCSDCLSGLFLLEGDVQMTVSIDLLRPRGQKTHGDDWCRIVGSEGSIEANPGLGTIRLIREGQPEELRTATAVAAPYYTAFLDTVLTSADFSEATALGLQLTDTVLTAGRAAAEGLCGVAVDLARWETHRLARAATGRGTGSGM